MTKKRGLGRGLGALIPSQEPYPMDEAGSGLRLVSVGAIRPNPHQPRGRLEEEALQELADSIREHGLIQPLIVQEEASGQYTLIAGERRWRASRQAGLDEVPVLVKEASPQEMLELALIENIQRADLNPLEEALAYQQLIEGFGLTQAQVARRVGKSRPTVANMVRLLNLPTDVQQAVTDGRMSGGHARTLLALPDPAMQEQVASYIIEHSLSVRQTEAFVQLLSLELPVNVQRALLNNQIRSEHARLLSRLPTPEQQTLVLTSILNNGLSVQQTEKLVSKLLAGTKPQPKRAARKTPEMLSLEAEFRQSLGFRVDVRSGAKGGQVVIHYYSDEDLQSIYDAIVDRDG